MLGEEMRQLVSGAINCPWVARGERIGNESLPGINFNVLEHVKY